MENRAIIYLTYGELKYVRAVDQNGDNWNTPIKISNSGIVEPAFAVVNGNPAIIHESESGTLDYIRATDHHGDSWGTPITIMSSVMRAFSGSSQ